MRAAEGGPREEVTHASRGGRYRAGRGRKLPCEVPKYLVVTGLGGRTLAAVAAGGSVVAADGHRGTQRRPYGRPGSPGQGSAAVPHSGGAGSARQRGEPPWVAAPAWPPRWRCWSQRPGAAPPSPGRVRRAGPALRWLPSPPTPVRRPPRRPPR